MDRLKGIEVSEEVRVQGQVKGPQAGIQQTRDHEIENDTAWLRNPNGNERPERGSGGTGVNVSLMGSPMRQSEAALTPTAPPEPVVLGPNEQCGVPVAPHSSEGKVGRQGLNAPLGVPQAFSTPLPNWDVKPAQTMLVNSDTRPHSLVHSDERRDRSCSRMSQPYADMSGQYAISSGSPNQSVRQNEMASLAPDFHHSVQAHADFASGIGSSNMPQSYYRPQTMSQEQVKRVTGQLCPWPQYHQIRWLRSEGIHMVVRHLRQISFWQWHQQEGLNRSQKNLTAALIGQTI